MHPGYPILRTARNSALLAVVALVCFASQVFAADIELYAGRSSVPAGGSITFHVSTVLASYDLRVYRFGAQVELVDEIKALPGRSYPVPADAAANGCRWPAAITYTIPPTWRSGIYAVCCIGNQQYSYTPFVVRSAEPGRSSGILYVVPIATYQAYNNYGGKSLYDGNSTDGVRSSRVSLDRPYAQDSGLGQFGAYEQPFTQWMEKNGIVADFCTSEDLGTSPGSVSGYGMLMTAGHDEYWSKETRDAVEDFVDSGRNLALFSANAGYWQVRWEDAGRSIVCYKDAASDPMTAVDPAHATVQFRDPPLNRPEASLFGVMYAGNSSYVGKPATVNDPNIWIFNGTSLQAGDSVGLNIVGYEWDDLFPVSPSGTRALLQTSISAFGQPSRSIASYYEKTADYGFSAGRGGKVFAAGTVQWSWGLDDIANAHSDPNMQRITLNVVRNLSAPHLSSRSMDVLFRTDTRALHLGASDQVSLVGGNPVLGFSQGVAMADDGAGADSVAGDGIFSALVTLPAGTPSPVPYGYRVNNVMATMPVSNGLLWVDETVDPGSFQVQPLDRIATPALVATPPPSRPLVRLALEAPRPNPFRASASLHFVIPGQLPPGGAGGDDGEGPRARISPIPTAGSAGAGIRTRLRIYDAAGRQVRTLLEGYMLPGPGSVQWDGRTAAGTLAGNGLYFARLEAGSESAAVKLLRVR